MLCLLRCVRWFGLVRLMCRLVFFCCCCVMSLRLVRLMVGRVVLSCRLRVGIWLLLFNWLGVLIFCLLFVWVIVCCVRCVRRLRVRFLFRLLFVIVLRWLIMFVSLVMVVIWWVRLMCLVMSWGCGY